MRRFHWVACGLAVLVAAGCGSPPPQEGVVVTTAADPPEPEVPLEVKSWDEVQQWVAGQKGKVVVVDVWSTWCVACMKEFPHFVELHQRSNTELACASVSIDFFGGEGKSPEDSLERVRKFLVSKNATMPNFLSSDADSKVLDAIGAASIPIVLVYGRDGNLHTIFSNDDEKFTAEGFTYEKDIVPLVDELLQAVQ